MAWLHVVFLCSLVSAVGWIGWLAWTYDRD
jgi:hypothetical protein